MFWCLFLRSWRRQVQMLRSHEPVHRARRAWGLAATQDLLAFESENIRKDFISEYLGDESDQRWLGLKSQPQWTKSSKEKERESHWKLDKVHRCQSTFTNPGLSTAIVKLKAYKMNIRLSLLISNPPPWQRLIIGLQDLFIYLKLFKHGSLSV